MKSLNGLLSPRRGRSKLDAMYYLKRVGYFLKAVVEFTIYESRWFLYPFYLKLILTLIILLYHFWMDKEVASSLIISSLHDADVAMVANLIKMIIVGSYSSFIDKTPSTYHVEKASSSGLKTKMSTSIVVVTLIFLLQMFLSMVISNWEEIVHRLIMFGVFIFTALILSVIEYIHVRSENIIALT